MRRKIEQIVAAEPVFAFQLTAVRRFPNVVWLEPEPAEPFQRLTRALAAAFPDYPPYGGAHEAWCPI